MRESRKWRDAFPRTGHYTPWMVNPIAQVSALERATQYSRIVWRNLKGASRWYVQLVQTGSSSDKFSNQTVPGMVVGLDVGP